MEPDKEAHTSLPRETAIETPLGNEPVLKGSAFGGYGELTLNARSDRAAVIDLRRFVLFFGHNFTDRLRFYSEVEVEHAVSSSGDQGEVEIEQAYLDLLLDKRINLRGGLVLMPVGIINVFHEPPSFNGVDRPDVDTRVIPTTWREPGVGIFGELTEGLRYQLFLVNGFNANGFTAENTIREGHQEAQLAHAGDLGAVLRLDFEPILGANLGASGYYGTSGNTLASTVGSVGVGIAEADVRLKRGGFSLRAEIAMLLIGNAPALTRALMGIRSQDQLDSLPIPSRAWGAYVEMGYDLFHVLCPTLEQALILFGRIDYADTQWKVPDAFNPNGAFQRRSLTAGLTYKPIPEIALKLDGRHHTFGTGDPVNEIASAITWMF